jgi:hypothetical protein
MDSAANKAIARRYFSEMVDERSDKLLEELWTEDCILHRPEVSATIKGREAFREAFNRVVGPYSEKTTIHELVPDNDLVVCHLSHKVVHRGGGWTSRLGSHAVVAGVQHAVVAAARSISSANGDSSPCGEESSRYLLWVDWESGNNLPIFRACPSERPGRK